MVAKRRKNKTEEERGEDIIKKIPFPGCDKEGVKRKPSSTGLARRSLHVRAPVGIVGRPTKDSSLVRYLVSLDSQRVLSFCPDGNAMKRHPPRV